MIFFFVFFLFRRLDGSFVKLRARGIHIPTDVACGRG